VLGATVLLVALSVTAAFAATPGQPAQEAADDAALSAHAERPYIGLVTVDLTRPIRRVLGVPDDVNGIVVVARAPGSPAAGADLQRADVAMSANDEALESPRHLERIVREVGVGGEIVLQVWRDDATHEVTLTVAAMPRPQAAPAWLREAVRFAKHHPNAIDGEIRHVDAENAIHTFEFTQGALATVTSDAITIQPKAGPAVILALNDGTVFYKNGERVRPSGLEPGERVLAVSIDGSVKAVLAAPFHQPLPDVALSAEMKERLQELKERRIERREQAREDLKQLKERMKELRESRERDDDDDDAPAGAAA